MDREGREENPRVPPKQLLKCIDPSSEAFAYAKASLCQDDIRNGLEHDFQVNILLAPDRKPREPVFSANNLLSCRPILFRQNSGSRLKLRSCNFAAKRAGGNLYPRVVADPLVFAGIAASHDVEFFVSFSEPDRGRNGNAAFAEGSKQEIFVSANRGRNGGSHGSIVRMRYVERFLRIAREPRSMLQAR